MRSKDKNDDTQNINGSFDGQQDNQLNDTGTGDNTALSPETNNMTMKDQKDMIHRNVQSLQEFNLNPN